MLIDTITRPTICMLINPGLDDGNRVEQMLETQGQMNLDYRNKSSKSTYLERRGALLRLLWVWFLEHLMRLISSHLTLRAQQP